MTGFNRVAPQRAQSDDGAAVEVVDRQTVRYSDADLAATIEVEFAAVTAIYPESLHAVATDGIPLALQPHRREDLVTRIEAGLASLGLRSERCNRPSEYQMSKRAPVLQLSPRWSHRLAAQPETGMGYQVVTVVLRDGRRFDRVLVESGSITRVDGLDSIPFRDDDIADLIVTHDR